MLTIGEYVETCVSEICVDENIDLGSFKSLKSTKYVTEYDIIPKENPLGHTL